MKKEGRITWLDSSNLLGIDKEKLDALEKRLAPKSLDRFLDISEVLGAEPDELLRFVMPAQEDRIHRLRAEITKKLFQMGEEGLQKLHAVVMGPKG